MAAAGIVEVVGRAERNKRDKRARLIAAARELFRTKGFEQTTTSEIAERADVGKGTLFFHARSKDELLVMVFQEDMGRTINRAFATVPEAPLLDQAMHVLDAMLRQDRQDLELARIFVKELAFVRGDHHGIDAVTDSFFSHMRVLIERAQRRREIKASVDPALLAYNMFALHFSFLVVWLGSGRHAPDPGKPSMRQMLEMQLAGLIKSPVIGRSGARSTRILEVRKWQAPK
ncbi:TetR/AcrR family transcriptional regulator [Candidatus Binatus sp.]|uniref:TetR/AcrR family transcriptional regulator n=1 Tax=Candidatus Binatus sp. TaxID=2811406 RepID=UPI003BAF113A